MDDTMWGNGLLGYFAGAWGDRRILAGLTEGWINLYRIFGRGGGLWPDGEHVLQQRHRTACWVGEAPCRSRDLHAARIAPYVA
jgi:hypothetical protein